MWSKKLDKKIILKTKEHAGNSDLLPVTPIKIEKQHLSSQTYRHTAE